MNNKLYFFLLSAGSILTVLGLIVWLRVYHAQLLSPVDQNSSFSFLQILGTKSVEKKLVYGFLPYWNLKKTSLQPELTQLSYFALTIQADGSVRLTEDGNTEPGYHKLQSEDFLELISQAQTQNTQLELVLAQFNNDAIAGFLNSDKAQEKIFTNLNSILLAYPFTGVNVDIEYSGEITDNLRAKYVAFLTKLNQHLTKTNPETKISIDVYGSAASKHLIWDLPAIAPQVDYVIMMAYDYHRRNSPISGPVAPLFGADSIWESDITKHLNDLITQVPAKKILLGVPFYGYEWRTTSRESRENTYPNSGSTASFERVQEILKQKEQLQVQENWDENALAPYLTYKENGAIYTIYYEDSRSLSYKADLVRQLDLAGIAIWALGYEGQHRELWDVIERKL